MKLFIITQRDCEYNDEYDEVLDGGQPIRAFRKRANAEAALPALEMEAIKGKEFAGYGEKSTLCFITEIEVEDADAVSYSSKLQAAQEAAEEARKMARKHLEDGAAELFSKHPTLQSFIWSQYTPYFNDGEECTFSVNDACFKFSDTPDKDEDDYGRNGYESPSEYGTPSPQSKLAAQRDVNSLLASVAADDMKAVFGDHVEITANAEGFTVDEYEHD